MARLVREQNRRDDEAAIQRARDTEMLMFNDRDEWVCEECGKEDRDCEYLFIGEGACCVCHGSEWSDACGPCANEIARAEQTTTGFDPGDGGMGTAP